VRLVRRERAQAEASLAAAQRLIEAIAASEPEAEAAAQLRQAAAEYLPRLTPLTALQQSKQAVGGLTRREREVAALAAEGKSNREIAEALVISVRTTKTHISHILAKLSLSTRAQLAAWARDKRLGE
jgi:non-specific serine/threonine protein kinase